MRLNLVRLSLIVFVSGFCSLVYQVTWLRSLRLVFGSSTTATAVVLAIFMGGLGLGGLLLGRRAERVRNPLDFYASIEIGIALFAAASPVLIGLARRLYLGFGGTGTLGLAGATAFRLVLAVLVLGVATTLMGGTLPAMAQAAERASDRGRRIVAMLYGVNTFGAVAGAFFTTFVLIELLGVRQSLWLAAAVNLLLGLVVRSMARLLADAESEESAGEEAPRSDAEARPPAVRVVLSAAFAVGFVFFLMELVWYRMLIPILGGTSYTFGLILTVALAGIGVGGWLYSRGSRTRRPSVEALALTCALEALCLVLPLALGDRLAYLALVLRGLAATGLGGLTLGWTLVTGLVVLPTAVAAGYQFPLLVALLGAGRRRVGPEVGLAYAWNTWGAILGALAGGFLLLPLLSAPRLWRFSAVALTVVAAALVAAAPRRDQGRARRGMTLAVGALSLLLCLAPGPTAFWRHSGIGAGRSDTDVTPRPNELRKRIMEAGAATWKEAEGIESSVALRRTNDLALIVNGKSDGAGVLDAPTVIMLGMVGAMLHPSPRKALVIGLGTGTTAGWLAQVPGMERVDVVELEPAVADLAREFASVNFGVTELPNVRLIFGDGREYVRTTSESYDLIASEPSNPYRAGVADLYSQEFYRAVRQRLEPGGIFAQWLQGYDVDPEVVGVAYTTLQSVFSHVESWQVHILDLLLVAGGESRVHDLDRLRERVSQEPFRSALARAWRVDGVEGLFTGYLGNPELARRIAERGYAISTDDQPLIEYGFARNLGRGGIFRVTDLQEMARRYGAARPATRGAPIDWDRVRDLRQVRQIAGSYLTGGSPADLPPAARARFAARLAYFQGDLRRAAAAWSSQPEGPMSVVDQLLVAESTIASDPESAGSLIARLEPAAPTEAAFLEARRSWTEGDGESAFEHLVQGLTALRTDPWAFEPIVRRAMELVPLVAARDRRFDAGLFAALQRPFAVYRFDDIRRLNRLELAVSNDFEKRCVAAVEPYEPHVLWEEYFLAARVLCYQLNQHPVAEVARRQLESFYAHSPRPLFDPWASAAAGEGPRRIRDLMEKAVREQAAGGAGDRASSAAAPDAR